jgi:hypothetical protein
MINGSTNKIGLLPSSRSVNSPKASVFDASAAGAPKLHGDAETTRALPDPAPSIALGRHDDGMIRTATKPTAAPKVAPTTDGADEAAVNSFVRQWFALIDKEVPESQLLPLLEDKGLNFRIPGMKIQSHADFKKTYSLLRFLLGDRSRHVIHQVDTKRIDAQTFDAHNRHTWEMKIFNVIPLSISLDEHWKVREEAGKLKIQEYLGKFA